MGFEFFTIVKGGKQKPITLKLNSEAQVPWKSCQITTYELCRLSFTSKWDIGAVTRLKCELRMGLKV
jgi:hypothetical protein